MIDANDYEQALRANGYDLQSDGSWSKPPRVRPEGAGPGDIGPTAELEPDPCHEPLAKEQVQEKAGAKFLVRITSFRRRLLDEDNLCEKFAVDVCRYAGALPSDSPDVAKIEVTQVKVGSKERECVRIQIDKTP